MGSHERRTGYERGNYDSGSDYVLEYGELRFTFNEQDFAERLEQSAKKLGIIYDDTVLSRRQRKDIMNLVTDGELPDASTDFGGHIDGIANTEALQEGADPSTRETSLISWLRRLVFRGAWLDQRVMEGELDFVFDETTGEFSYIQSDRNNEPIKLLEPPNYWEKCVKRKR